MIEQSTYSHGHSQKHAPNFDACADRKTDKTPETSSSVNSFGSVEQLYDRIRKTANINSTVLITGESGAGKSTIARMIHEQSPRRNGPFVTLNCAALPREQIKAELSGRGGTPFVDVVEYRVGCLEAADGGTLFLDEIGDLPLDLQPGILTVLQDRIVKKARGSEPGKVDVRLVVATVHDLGVLCQQGKFRDDLFYRLNVLPISVPPLRERKSELPKFVQNLMMRIGLKQNLPTATISHEAMLKIHNHDWPGNIRELENVLERASVFCNDRVILPDDIVIDQVEAEANEAERQSDSSVFHGKTLAEIEKLAIIATLEFCNGNKALSARTLGISEKSIYNKMKRLGISY